jgi:hypothetical protein
MRLFRMDSFITVQISYSLLSTLAPDGSRVNPSIFDGSATCW